MDQCLSRSLLKSYLLGMFPISCSLALGGVSGESSVLSSPSLSGLGDFVGYSRTRKSKGTFEKPFGA